MLPKKNKLIIIISCLVLVLLVGLIILLNDKTKYFKKITNETFATLEKITNVSENIPILTKGFKNISLEVKDNDNTNDTLNVALNVDNTNKYLELKGQVSNNNKETFNGSFIYQNGKTYIDEKNILKNTYHFDLDLTGCNGNENCTVSEFYLSNLIENSLSDTMADYTKVNKIVKSLKKVATSSFINKYVEVRKITNGSEKQTRYSYVLNKDSLKKFASKIDNNKTLKDDIFEVFGDILNNLGITKTNFKEKLLGVDGNIGTITITVINNKINKVVLNITNKIEITLKPNEDNNIMEIKTQDSTNGRIVYNNNTKAISVKLYDTDSNALELEFTSNNNKLQVDYSIYNETKKKMGTIINTTSTNEENTLAGTLNIKTNNLNANINYNISTDIKDKTNITNALEFNDLSEEEVNNITNNLKDALENGLVNKFFEAIKESLGILG